jgi:hypothetical protein
MAVYRFYVLYRGSSPLKQKKTLGLQCANVVNVLYMYITTCGWAQLPVLNIVMCSTLWQDLEN